MPTTFRTGVDGFPVFDVAADAPTITLADVGEALGDDAPAVCGATGAADPLGAGLTPLDGGFSGETFLAEVAGERSVVRIYADRGARRGSQAPEVDAGDR